MPIQLKFALPTTRNILCNGNADCYYVANRMARQEDRIFLIFKNKFKRQNQTSSKVNAFIKNKKRGDLYGTEE